MSLDSDWNSYLQIRLLKENLSKSGHHINSVYEKCSESQVQRPQKIKKKIFQCPKCEHTATQRGNLRRHIAGVHEAERKYKCQQCDHKTAQKSNLQIHIKLKHEGKRLPCPHCNHISSQVSYLKQHIQSEHEGKNYLKNKNLQNKNHVNEGEQFPCPHCDYIATQKIHLNGHIKAKHEGKKLQCPDCQFSSSWPRDFSRHMKDMHSKTISQKRRDLQKYLVNDEIDYFDIDIID